MPAQSAALEAQGALLNSLHAMASALPTAFGFELCCVAVLRCHMDRRVELSPWGSRFLWGLSLALTAPTNLGRVSLSASGQVLPRSSTPALQNVSWHHPVILVATILLPPPTGVKVDWAYAPGQVKVLTSSDGANFEEAKCWQSSSRMEAAYEDFAPSLISV